MRCMLPSKATLSSLEWRPDDFVVILNSSVQQNVGPEPFCSRTHTIKGPEDGL